MLVVSVFKKSEYSLEESSQRIQSEIYAAEDFFSSSSQDTTFINDLFLIKDRTTQQPVLTVTQSIVQFATQSSIPTGTTNAGSIWFTSSSLYVGLE